MKWQRTKSARRGTVTSPWHGARCAPTRSQLIRLHWANKWISPEPVNLGHHTPQSPNPSNHTSHTTSHFLVPREHNISWCPFPSEVSIESHFIHSLMYVLQQQTALSCAKEAISRQGGKWNSRWEGGRIKIAGTALGDKVARRIFCSSPVRVVTEP